MKKHYALKIAGIAAASVCILAALFFIRSTLQVRKLEKLSMDDSPTAAYTSLMPDNDEIYS